MSNVKISELTSASTPLTGTEEIPVVQSGTTYKTTAQDIADLASGGTNYLVYTALLSQSSAVLTVTVLENTLGTDLTWTIAFNGTLRGTADSGTPFTLDKTWLTSGGFSQGSSNPYIVASAVRSIAPTTEVEYRFFFHDGTITGTPNITNYSIEIRVYP